MVELLRVSAGDGRLTAEERDERIEAALTARTYNELAALVADLPDAPGAVVSTPAARPREVVRIDCQHGNANRQDRWTVPQRMEVRIKSGNVTLDITDPDIASPPALPRFGSSRRNGCVDRARGPGQATGRGRGR